MSHIYDIIIFSSCNSHYTDAVIDYLDPHNKYISFRIYRDSCFYTNQGYLVKDLRIINRPLEEIVIVDNCA